MRRVLLGRPGVFLLTDVPDGRYHLFAAALGKANDVRACLLPNEGHLVGPGGTVEIRGGSLRGQARAALRPRRLTDPPMVVALPVV